MFSVLIRKAMKTYVLVGGFSSVAQALIKKLERTELRVVVFSQQQNLIHYHSNIEWHQLNVVKEDIPAMYIPEMVNALVYFPGTINLKPFNTLTADDFQSDFEINLLGAVKAIKAFYRPLKKSGNGSIVMFSSVAARLGMPYHASIASSKAAIEGLTRSLAAEFAPHIRVNCIAPSLTDTRMASKLLSNEERRNSIVQRNPMKKIGTPDDLASMVKFLTGDNGSWITGQVISVDGGLSTINLT